MISKRVTLALVLTIGLFGFEKTALFAQTNANELNQKGIELQRHEKFAEAFQLFLTAAEAGNAEGQYHAGYCYLTGQGTTLNDEQARKWFQKGADQGDPKCKFYLGSIYENGYGVPQDPNKSKEYYQAASHQGFAGATDALRRINSTPPNGNENNVMSPAATTSNEGGAEAWLEQGKAAGAKKEFSQSVSFFQMSADAGNIEAQAQLGACYLLGLGIKKDIPLGAQWVHKAAQAGNARAQSLLGNLYHDGAGLPKNIPEAVIWEQKSADQNCPEGEFILGAYYATGDGVTRDSVKAKELLQRAADQGYPPAKKVLAKLAKKGSHAAAAKTAMN